MADAERIAEFVSTCPPNDPETGKQASAMLVKWTLIAEWMGTNGDRYYVQRAGNGAGDGLSPSDFKGLLFESLFGKLIG